MISYKISQSEQHQH
jgi:hypothetical protein